MTSTKKNEGHVFHLQNPESDKALKFFKKFVEFIIC
ncbi:hypothetical protein AALP_AA4G063800 [Arabis alpina]|uniref:Uncharacterized protein n=1 Tax=Arabis alpina TaxID=50452 RepID=A0A087H1I8_ARAAL|nr:hypothetical protein AALP_AA4G063800 [Arabis alpina]